ncbi:NADH-quinone oxidoreductase subunit N [Dyadobacter tibetensis]|uniref:NADH-quinone oxidoreductase subunit N n=1 Tax=Dyadobacter tibetensis TaxID=1211851 RepID=UPI0004BC3AB7|nr:NADH-quinone oxidoreductase subunit N [Dyadobacter tibetensis]
MDSLPSLCTFAKKIVPAPLDLNEQLLHIRQSLTGILPEIFLMLLFCVILLAELILIKSPKRKQVANILHGICVAGALITFVLVCCQWDSGASFRFYPLLFLDHQAIFFKLLILSAWLFTLMHVRLLKYDFPPEFNAILIVTVAGLHLLVMSTHLLTIYLCIELVSICSYLLVALQPNRKAAEGGIKYLLFGATSSAVMLYGISLVYGLTATMNITDPGLYSGLMANEPVVSVTAMVMLLGGLLFKLSLVPFHVWTPDVYEAAPTPLVSFLSVAPKAAVLLVVIRLTTALPDPYFPVLGGIALISITMGNVGALWQRNARRLMAYSSIAQAGYLIIGVTVASKLGFESAVFYVAAYLIVNLAVFFLIDLLQPRSSANLADFEGLGRNNVLVAAALTVALIALAGLPPTVGFTAKLLIFSALWDGYQHQESTWMLWLLIGGILNAAVALAYYLRLPYLLFFKEEKDLPLIPAMDTFSGKTMALGLTLLILGLFARPEWLMNWISAF